MSRPAARVVRQLAVHSSRPESEVRRVLEALVDVIESEVAGAGRQVTLRGLGTFRPHTTKPRRVQGVAGEHHVPSRVTVKFRAVPRLRGIGGKHA